MNKSKAITILAGFVLAVGITMVVVKGSMKNAPPDLEKGPRTLYVSKPDKNNKRDILLFNPTIPASISVTFGGLSILFILYKLYTLVKK